MPDKWYVSTPPDTQTVHSAFYERLRAHLRLGDDHDDVNLTDLINAGISYAEESTSSAIFPQTITATFYEGERIKLPRGPLIGITSVTDKNDAPITAYSIRQVGHATFIDIEGACAYPATVVYQAGHSTVPASFIVPILAHACTLYENRESVNEKQKTPVPHSLEDFYRLKKRSTGIG